MGKFLIANNMTGWISMMIKILLEITVHADEVLEDMAINFLIWNRFSA
jgi:hypothetical protein